MPRKPRASQSIRAITRNPVSGPLPLDVAIDCPWICPNSATAINALLVDVDHDDILDLLPQLAAVGAPVPDVILDPWSGRAHAVLWLADPVPTHEGALAKPQKTADYALRLLAAALCGSPMPQGGLIKSPWGRVSALIGSRLKRGVRPSVPDRWDAYVAAAAAGSDLMWITRPGTGPAELRDVIRTLAPMVEFDARSSRPKDNIRKNRGIPDGRGRNCECFDLLRWWAYDHKEDNLEALLHEADRINNSGIFAVQLGAAEIGATARSVARFMRTRYAPRPAADLRCNRGRDAEAGAEMELRAKRVFAAVTSAKANLSRTEAKIAAGLQALRAAGTSVTQTTLARAAGISVRTIQSRWRADPNPQNGALSGGAALRAAVGAEAPMRKAKSPSLSLPSTLAGIAARDRLIRRTLAALAKSSAAARRRGAVPAPLPPVPSAIAGESSVLAARREAESAVADARRRAADRQVKAKLAARRKEMCNRLAEDPAAACSWWRQQVADMDMEWDAREADADDNRELASLKARREAVMGGRWSTWKAALRHFDDRRPAPAIPW